MKGSGACKFIKKETPAQVFSCEFWEIPKNTLFTKHLWTTASGRSRIVLKDPIRQLEHYCKHS